MANISITSVCNRSCAFCFAHEAARSGSQNMGEREFENVLNFLERSGIDQVRLLGGEPTLHPGFVEMVEMALRRGFRVMVFSNGILAEPVLQLLEAQDPERVTILLNVSVRDRRQTQTLHRLGPRISLSYTISDSGSDFSFLIGMIQEFGLAQCVRLGLAHPSPEGRNKFLHPRDYPAAGRVVLDFWRRARDEGIQISFDCGFVPCMFPEGALAELGTEAVDIGPRCSPVLDVLPDCRVVPCFPLAGFAPDSLSDTVTAADLRARMTRSLSGWRRLGIYKECSNCDWRQNQTCAGGCLAATSVRLRNFAKPDGAAEPNPIRRRWVVPYIDQPLSFWQRLQEEFGRHLLEVYFPFSGGLVGSGSPAQPPVHLEKFMTGSRLPRSVLINAVVLPKPADEMAGPIIEGLRRLIGEWGVSRATVTDLRLAARIREKLPDLPLSASVLMDIAHPQQALMLNGICDTLVPSTRIMRDLPALQALRSAFSGRIRLIVNEACIPGCPYRTQHFYEMGCDRAHPESLCSDLLDREPWIRMTGAWILPQHLHLLSDVADEFKLAGRVTLRDPVKYRKVLRAYTHGSPWLPTRLAADQRPSSIRWRWVRSSMPAR